MTYSDLISETVRQLLAAMDNASLMPTDVWNNVTTSSSKNDDDLMQYISPRDMHVDWVNPRVGSGRVGTDILYRN